jgi:glycosyltransferase involved in cell wall biosynthesis
MRIAIDASSVPAKPAGAGMYAIQLVRALAARGRGDGYALFTHSPALDEIVGGRRDWRIERVHAGSRPLRLAWEQVMLPGAIERLRIDVLHSTHHTLPLRPVRARRVVTVHDLTFFRLPARYPPARRLYMQALTRLSVRAADAVIVPSEIVRLDVLRLFDLPEERVVAIHEAAAPGYAPMDREAAAATAARYGLRAPYVLSVGSSEPGKNRGRLFRALSQLRAEGHECTLAVVGQAAWGRDAEERAVESLGLGDAVRFLGYVPQSDMTALYNAATAFVFPSLYEGFGLPVIEAMACGVPVLTSNVSATAEVAGDAALLVNPRSVEEVRDGLRRLLTEPALRDDLGARGSARAAQFSWARAAEETYAVYRRLVEARPARA